MVQLGECRGMRKVEWIAALRFHQVPVGSVELTLGILGNGLAVASRR